MCLYCSETYDSHRLLVEKQDVRCSRAKQQASLCPFVCPASRLLTALRTLQRSASGAEVRRNMNKNVNPSPIKGTRLTLQNLPVKLRRDRYQARLLNIAALNTAHLTGSGAAIHIMIDHVIGLLCRRKLGGWG